MPGLIIPGLIDADASTRDSYMMLGLTLLLFAFCFNLRGTRSINRYEGGIFVLIFLAYQYWLFS
jgi:cation:H+ antiporter